ncbi:MAG: right-handed parallel beta-helix repeat-containing protein, partial [Ignavibacteriales bacterium]|nr:right-handed parallel beta-helix repeat-containing protein [Ignavibacteriales bacterium]
KGDWAYIQVGTSSAESTTLDHCVIKYGGVSSPAYYASLYVYNGNATLNTCDINNSKNYGIILTSSATVTLNSTSISSCDWPISYSSPGSLVFNGINTLTGNTHNGIYLNFSSNANTFVLDTIDVPYVLLSSYTVNASGIFEIASSNVIKFGDYCYFYVDGTLEAIAGTGESIDFTTYRNDNIGGDTNGDGTATVPSPRIWGGIYFNNSSIDAACVLRRCNVTYGGYWTGGGINMSNASPTIDSCSMANNYYGVMMTGVSDPVFTNNTIGSSTMTPIEMSFSCNPVFSNNTFSFSDNTYDAIGLLGGTLPADAVIPICYNGSKCNICTS